MGTGNDQYAYDLCVLPRPAGICSARAMLETISEVLQMVTEAGDLPPAGISYDGGTPNSALNSMLLGLCSREAMQEWPFFRCCHTKETSFAYWPFRMLQWKDYLMVSFNGAFRYLKRLALQCLSGCRVIYMGSVFVNVSGGLEAGLPEHVYHAADPQSDKAGAMLSSPPYMAILFGTMLMALLSGLLVSSTTGSLGYDLRDIALHAFVAYYLLVLRVAHNQQVFGREWRTYSLADVTIRNGCGLCHFIVMSTLEGLEPKLMQEIAIERHFSLLKQPFRGAPSLRDFMFGNWAA